MYFAMSSPQERGDPSCEIELRPLNTRFTSSDCKYILGEYDGLKSAFRGIRRPNIGRRVPMNPETRYATQVENVITGITRQFQFRGWSLEGFCPKIVAVRIAEL
jgi:hypothetical protein